ncbi:MAG: S53 family peptidase [Verrucomicrobiota bacterium]|jgi:subtilase family serine protease
MTNKLSGMIAGLALFALLTTSVQAAGMQSLPGHVPAAVARLNLQPLGRLAATNRLYLLIGLPLRNQVAFSNLMSQLYNPTSRQYHHWLTPAQIAQRFGPTEQDYQTVIAWAKTNGLMIVATHEDHTLLRVQGSVADIENVFHVKMQVYQHPTEARTFYAPDVEPSVDLSVPLFHITGLDNLDIPHPVGPKRTQHRPVPNAVVYMGSGPTNSYWGNDFRAAYVPGNSPTGFGQSLGILAMDDYYSSDIASYISQSGISTSVAVVRIPVDGGVQNPSADNDEISLDIEMAIAMAPGLAEVRVYEGSTDITKYVDILKQMQEDNIADQLSSSIVVEELDTGLNPNADVVYQEFAIQGQSFFQASGDYGPYYQGVLQWADDPYVTIVGGTTLTDLSPGGSYASENVWPTSGGGVSSNYLGNYPIPGWQQGVSMVFNGGSTTMRDVPDVAMLAQAIYLVSNNGSNTIVSGTSAATPLWAGFTALVNQQAVANEQPTVGFLNPALYAIGLGPNYKNCFHDITNGVSLNNPNGFNNPPLVNKSVIGYDLATGWGTPNGTNLINALMPYTGAIWVDFNYSGSTQNGSYDAPFSTLAQGVSKVSPNGNIWIRTAGSSPETMTIAKPMTIRAANGPATIGN